MKENLKMMNLTDMAPTRLKNMYMKDNFYPGKRMEMEK